MRKKKTKSLEWEEAHDIQSYIKELVEVLEFNYIDPTRIFCYRTEGSTSRSYARIWAFPKIFQTALQIQPAYVVEVLAKYFDPLDDDEKKKVLIHELLHIPKNFSGALVPHQTRTRRISILTNQLFKQYKNSK